MSAYPNTAEAPASAGSNPYTQSAPPPFAASPIRTSPGLAFMLGFIPGVGAIYNGQYLKGLVHAVIFGLLIAMMSNAPSGPQIALVMLFCAFCFYMPFEAYHTARKRQLGLEVDEFSSIAPRGPSASRAPVGPIALIALGILFLLDTMHLVNFRELARFWPVLLILIGIYMLYGRMKAPVIPHPPSAPFVASETYPARSSSPSDLMGKRNE